MRNCVLANFGCQSVHSARTFKGRECTLAGAVKQRTRLFNMAQSARLVAIVPGPRHQTSSPGSARAQTCKHVRKPADIKHLRCPNCMLHQHVTQCTPRFVHICLYPPSLAVHSPIQHTRSAAATSHCWPALPHDRLTTAMVTPTAKYTAMAAAVCGCLLACAASAQGLQDAATTCSRSNTHQHSSTATGELVQKLACYIAC